MWANIWFDARVAVIDPASGAVRAFASAAALQRHVRRAAQSSSLDTDANAVLNGVAFDASARRLFLTGKLWPTLFEVELPELP